MEWPTVYFAKFLNHLGRFSKWFAMVSAFVVWLVGAIDKLVGSAIAGVTNLLNSFNIDELGNVNFSGLEYIGYVNAIIPLDYFITICGVYVTAWIVVILIRWVKSFVPAISN